MGIKDSFINMISFIKIKYTNIDTKLTELKNTVTSLSTNFDNLSNEFNDIGGVVDYTDKISFNTTNLNNKWSTSIKKVGHTVNFIINITVNATSTNIAELGTLPEEVLTKNQLFATQLAIMDIHVIFILILMEHLDLIDLINLHGLKVMVFENVLIMSYD